jgi:predicted nucleic acid-binding Zn ribbon protein
MEREPRSVVASLDVVARRLGAPPAAVVARIFAHWDELVGPDIADHARPLSLRDGVLTVQVDHPAWATQLRYLSPDLLRRLREATGSEDLRELKLRVRPDR